MVESSCAYQSLITCQYPIRRRSAGNYTALRWHCFTYMMYLISHKQWIWNLLDNKRGMNGGEALWCTIHKQFLPRAQCKKVLSGTKAHAISSVILYHPTRLLMMEIASCLRVHAASCQVSGFISSPLQTVNNDTSPHWLLFPKLHPAHRHKGGQKNMLNAET